MFRVRHRTSHSTLRSLTVSVRLLMAFHVPDAMPAAERAERCAEAYLTGLELITGFSEHLTRCLPFELSMHTNGGQRTQLALAGRTRIYRPAFV